MSGKFDCHGFKAYDSERILSLNLTLSLSVTV